MARKPIHPGTILGDELEFLGMSFAALARAIHVPTNRLSQIVAGKRAISADTALRLGKWLGTGPELWINLQKTYEIDLARLTTGKDIDAIVPRRAA